MHHKETEFDVIMWYKWLKARNDFSDEMMLSNDAFKKGL